MCPAASPPVLKFGAFVVDLNAGELRKNGSRIRLQEKPLRVLALLAEHQGQTVSRDELKKHLWPEDTFVDFETGLNTAVKKLRGALSDDAENPRYIETLPRRGYRLIPPVEFIRSNGKSGVNTVEVVTEELRAEPASAVAPDGAPARRAELADGAVPPLRIWRRVIIATAMAAVAFGFWWVTPLPDPKVLKMFPVTSMSKQDYLVRPATDGARIFYVERAGDHWDSMQASVRGGEAEKMQVPFRNTLIWDVSQDGSKYLITSFERRGEPSQLWSWPVTGGAPIKLDDMISGSAVWSPDGKLVAYHIGKELWVGNADGSAKRKLGTFTGNVDNPAWSPDGTRVRFMIEDPDKNTSKIWEIQADGNGFRMVNLSPASSATFCCGSWTPDGRYYIYVDSSEPLSKLMAMREKGDWLRRSPRGPFLLAAEASGTWSPSVGRDGQTVYFFAPKSQGELQMYDSATHQFSSVLPTMHPIMTSVSRDGQWAAYFSLDRGELWRSRLDGSEARALPFPAGTAAFPRWSPDGKTIAFTGHARGSFPNAYTISVEGGKPQQLALGIDNLGDPDWSADGLQLVVDRELPAAEDKAPVSVLGIVDWKDHSFREIAGSNGLGMPRWSPDGKAIAAVTDERKEVRLYDVAAAKWTTIAAGKSFGNTAWSADSAYLYYQEMMEPGQPVVRMKLATGVVETVVNFQKLIDSGVSSCIFNSLTLDGKVMVGVGRGNADIYGATLSLP